MIKKIGLNKMALIVDDDLELRDTIGVDFSRKGFKVFTCGNGEEALEVLKKNHIDIIVSDIQMPVCDGICLLTKAKGLFSTIPIFIFISGFSNYNKEQLEGMGAYALLPKPFDRKIMFEVLEKALTA